MSISEYPVLIYVPFVITTPDGTKHIFPMESTIRVAKDDEREVKDGWSLMAILAAYEMGVGQAGRDLANPFMEKTQEWEAYNAGVTFGKDNKVRTSDPRPAIMARLATVITSVNRRGLQGESLSKEVIDDYAATTTNDLIKIFNSGSK